MHYAFLPHKKMAGPKNRQIPADLLFTFLIRAIGFFCCAQNTKKRRDFRFPFSILTLIVTRMTL